MDKELNIFEFNAMFNQAKPIFEVSTKLSFFDARVLNNMLLLIEIQHYCREVENGEGNRYSLDLILEMIQNKLHKNTIMTTRKKIEGMCDDTYYYIFMLR